MNVTKESISSHRIVIELNDQEYRQFVSDLGDENITGQMWDKIYSAVR